MTILTLLRTELRRLTATRLGVLAFVALMAVPLLYGGMYLWGNRDPYGSFDQVPAAVVVLDAGTTTDGTTVNRGRDAADAIVADGAFDWRELTAAQARTQLQRGDVDFVITFPKDFSAALASVGTTSPTRTSVGLTTNDANSYLSSTIAKQVATQVRDTVATQVGRTAANSFLVALADIRSDLTDAQGGAATLADGAEEAHDGAVSLADGTKSLASGASSVASGAATAASGAAALASGATRTADGAATLSSGLGTLAARSAALPTGAGKVATGAKEVAAGNASLAASLHAAATAAAGTPLAAKLQQAADAADTLAAGSSSVASGAASVQSGASSMTSAVQRASSGAEEVAAGTKQVSSGATTLASGTRTLASGSRTLATGAASAAAGSASLATGTKRLASGADDLAAGLRKGVTAIPATTAAQRTAQAGAIGNPLSVTTTDTASAGSYGAGLAPLFLSLSAWIGSYALFLILRPLSRRAITAVRQPVRIALAGWLTPALFGVVQMVALLGIAVGPLGIAVRHPWLTLGILMLTAGAFAAILLLLNAALGSVGQFLGLVLMLVQLVTAGGTFPWQTLPAPLAALHHSLPMSYAVDALRQAMYGGDLSLAAGDAGVLGIWLVAALALTAAIAARQTRRRTLRDLQPSLIGG